MSINDYMYICSEILLLYYCCANCQVRTAVDTPTAFNYALKPLFTDFSENSSLIATISHG